MKWVWSAFQSLGLVLIGNFVLDLGFWENAGFVVGMIVVLNCHDSFLEALERERSRR